MAERYTQRYKLQEEVKLKLFLSAQKTLEMLRYHATHSKSWLMILLALVWLIVTAQNCSPMALPLPHGFKPRGFFFTKNPLFQNTTIAEIGDNGIDYYHMVLFF